MMRPNKQMNPGANPVYAPRRAKSRYFTTDLPRDPEGPPQPAIGTPPANQGERESPPSKYLGRASIGRVTNEADLVVDLTEAQEWVDPLDDDGFDLSSVTIDLRQTLRRDPPDSYYERYSSRVPGHQ